MVRSRRTLKVRSSGCIQSRPRISSDWTLCLGTEKAYRVHRLVLDTGPRSSTIFARVFASCAQAFEAGLYFAYGLDETDKFSTYTALGPGLERCDT